MSNARAQNYYDPGNCGVVSVLKDTIVLVCHSHLLFVL
jgi:hypothetical protein